MTDTHIILVPKASVEALKKWLADPNGAHRVNDRLTFEAVEGDQLMIKSSPYQPKSTPRGVQT